LATLRYLPATVVNGSNILFAKLFNFLFKLIRNLPCLLGWASAMESLKNIVVPNLWLLFLYLFSLQRYRAPILFTKLQMPVILPIMIWNVSLPVNRLLLYSESICKHDIKVIYDGLFEVMGLNNPIKLKEFIEFCDFLQVLL